MLSGLRGVEVVDGGIRPESDSPNGAAFDLGMPLQISHASGLQHAENAFDRH